MGRCVIYTSMHPDNPVEISAGRIHNTQMTITGAVSPSIESFATSVALLSKGIVKPECLVSEKIEYTKPNEAFEAAVRPDTYRVMMTF